jgi:hypothetical protein
MAGGAYAHLIIEAYGAWDKTAASDCARDEFRENTGV